MDKNIANEMMDAAIEWYVSFIEEPEYSERANGPLQGQASLLATLVKIQGNNSTTVSKKQIAVFRDEFKKHAQKYADKKWRLSLDVDWAPEWPLSDFLRTAEIPNTFFPSKTMVWLDFNKQTVTTDWNGGQQIYPKLP